MWRWRQFLAKLNGFLRRERAESELTREVDAHLSMLEDEFRRRGMSPFEARQAARRAFGGIERTKNLQREERSFPSWDEAIQDLRYAARALRRSPGFSLASILILALGIGASSALFSVVHAVLLKPLPYFEPDQLYSVELLIPRPQREFMNLRGRIQDYLEWRKSGTAVGALTSTEWNVTGSEEPERVRGLLVSTNYFSMLGVQMVHGRGFAPEEERPGSDRVAIVGFELWRRRYGSDPSLVGRSIVLNGQSYRVIGIAPQNLLAPTGRQVGGSTPFQPRADIWTPWAPTINELQGENHNCEILVKLRKGEDPERARQQMQSVMNGWMRESSPQMSEDWMIRMIPIREILSGDVRLRVLLVFGASALLLLIACTNIANLFLARAVARSRELATRIALGAGRFRLVMQMLTESILLAAAGGIVGAAFAYWGCRLLILFGPAEMPLLGQARLTLPVLIFTILVSIVVGLACGVFPACMSYRKDIVLALKEGPRNSSSGTRSIRLRHSLVGIEIALGTVLLTSTGLLLHSFLNVMNVDRGYRVDRILTVDMALSGNQYSTPAQRLNFYRGLTDRIRGISGVLAVGAVSALPADGSTASNRVNYPTDTEEDAQRGALLGRPIAGVWVTTPGYFAAAEIALRAGRFYTDTDRGTVAVISESLAKRLWPSEPLSNIVGRQIRQGDAGGPLITILGVAGDVRSGSLDRDLAPQLYRPHSPQRAFGLMSLVVRTQQEPEALSSLIRAEVRKMDANLPIPALRTMKEVVSASVAPRRFQLGLISLFGFMALVLAAVGVYGVVSYSVVCRTRDIGLRIALGAAQHGVLRWVLWSGMRPVLIGLFIGLVCSLMIGRVLQSALFEVAATDPFSVGGMTAVLLFTSVLACYVPARRAARLDPVTALRLE